MAPGPGCSGCYLTSFREEVREGNWKEFITVFIHKYQYLVLVDFMDCKEFSFLVKSNRGGSGF